MRSTSRSAARRPSEDVPLLARHLLSRIAARDRAMAERFFPAGDPSAAPRLAPDFVSRLVVHPFATHSRELEHLLWRAIGAARGDVLGEGEIPDFPGPKGPRKNDFEHRRRRCAPAARSGGAPNPRRTEGTSQGLGRSRDTADGDAAAPECRSYSCAGPKVGAGSPPANPFRDPACLSPEEVQACLDRHGGAQEPAWPGASWG